MGKAPTLRQLQAMSDDQLVEAYDAHAQNTVVGTGFYLEELRSREMEHMTRQMLHLTRWIAGFTFVVTVATIINVVLVAWAS